MVIVIIELFQDTISVILRNVGTKAKVLKNIISDREEVSRGWGVGRSLARGGAGKRRSWGGSCACKGWGMGGGWGDRLGDLGVGVGWKNQAPGIRRCWTERIEFVYSKIHSSLQVSEFGQKCPTLQQARDDFYHPLGYSRSYLILSFSVVPVTCSVEHPCLCSLPILSWWNMHLSSSLLFESTFSHQAH